MVNNNAARISAEHTNGYVRMAVTRTGADIGATVARLQAAGYWKNITVKPETVKAR